MGISTRKIAAEASTIVLIGSFLNLLGCEPPHSVLYVTVKGLPQEAQALQVSVQLVQDRREARFTSDLDHFSISLRPADSGHLELTASALDNKGCVWARGVKPHDLVSNDSPMIELDLTQLQVEECAKTQVEVRNEMLGTITSTPAGIECPGRCSHEFAPGTSVRFTSRATIAHANFLGWGGACSGLSDCTVTTGSLTPKVIASFGKELSPMPGWYWENPFPLGTAGKSVWGGGQDLFIVGLDGMILRWDGAGWQPMESGTTVDLYGIGGLAAPRHGLQPDLFAVGAHGTILRLGATGWQKLESPTTSDLYSIWMASAEQGYAVGSGGVILKWDGSEFTLMETVSSSLLFSVGGSAPTAKEPTGRIFAVGEKGAIFKLDGSRWQRLESGTQDALHLIKKLEHSDKIYALGDIGNVLTWNGASWSRQQLGLLYRFRGMVELGPDQVLASAVIPYLPEHVERILGASIFNDGTGWQNLEDTKLIPTTNIAENDRRVLIGAREDGTIVRWREKRWQTQNSLTTSDVHAITRVSDNRLIAVGSYGLILDYDGTTWRPMNSGTTQELWTVWASGPDNFLVGGSDGMLRYNGTEWQPEVGIDAFHPNAIHGSGKDLIVAIANSTSQMGRWNGTRWVKESIPAECTALSGVYMAGPNDVYVTGGLQVDRMGPPTGWPDYVGCIMHWNGSSWQRVYKASPPGDEFGALSAISGSGPNDVIAVSPSFSRVVRWDGTTWTDYLCLGILPVAISQLGPGDLYLADFYGLSIAHLSGGRWQLMRAPRSFDFRTLAASPNGIVHIGGSYGHLLRYEAQMAESEPMDCHPRPIAPLRKHQPSPS